MRKIEDDVPLPMIGAGRKAGFMTFQELEIMLVGQSFAVPEAERRAATAAVRKRHKTTTRRFAIRRTNQGARIWRTK